MQDSRDINERGMSAMRNSFEICVVLCVIVCTAIMLWNTDQASSQMIREPSIEGVSYSEIAQWQSVYGGGPFLRRGYLPAYCAQPVYEPEYCETDEPPVRKTQKHKTRSSTK